MIKKAQMRGERKEGRKRKENEKKDERRKN